MDCPIACPSLGTHTDVIFHFISFACWLKTTYPLHKAEGKMLI
nr:MAG TPA: hypothetical protein [Crassvirales sp.]